MCVCVCVLIAGAISSIEHYLVRGSYRVGREGRVRSGWGGKEGFIRGGKGRRGSYRVGREGGGPLIFPFSKESC